MKSSFFATLLCATLAVARPEKFLGQGWKGHWKLPGHHLPAPAQTGNTTFKQLIDHSNPSLGTFDQTYWWSSEFWKGPGYPVIVSHFSTKFPSSMREVDTILDHDSW